MGAWPPPDHRALHIDYELESGILPAVLQVIHLVHAPFLQLVAEDYPFSSLLSSFMNRQSVPCVISLCGPVLISPLS